MGDGLGRLHWGHGQVGKLGFEPPHVPAEKEKKGDLKGLYMHAWISNPKKKEEKNTLNKRINLKHS